jgi:hypothetical protein
MTCVVCGKESTYWLCSNACALVYTQERAAVDCAICSVDPKTGQRGTNQTTELCEECRRDPANAGWSEKWPSIDLSDQLDAAAIQLENNGIIVAPRSFAEIEGRPIKPATKLEKKILLLFVSGKAQTVREAADQAGCSYVFVNKVIKRYWGDAGTAGSNFVNRIPVLVGNENETAGAAAEGSNFVNRIPVLVGNENETAGAAAEGSNFVNRIPVSVGEQHRELIRLAFEEFKVTRQLNTGNGEAYLAQWGIPDWFVRSELGYGTGEGPSLEVTLRTLDRTNATRRRLYEGGHVRRQKLRWRKGQVARETRAALRAAGMSEAEIRRLTA